MSQTQHRTSVHSTQERTAAGVAPTRTAILFAPDATRLALNLGDCDLSSRGLVDHRHFLFFQVLLFLAGELVELAGRDKLGQGPANTTQTESNAFQFVNAPTTDVL